MESNYHGVDRETFIKELNAAKKKYFDELRIKLKDVPPMTRDEAFKRMAEIAAENKKRKEQQDRDNTSA